jgi:hypothetical protein
MNPSTTETLVAALLFPQNRQAVVGSSADMSPGIIRPPSESLPDRPTETQEVVQEASLRALRYFGGFRGDVAGGGGNIRSAGAVS